MCECYRVQFLQCETGAKLLLGSRNEILKILVALPEQIPFSSSPSFSTVEPLACLSSTSPFSSSLTALLALTNLMDLDSLNVTSPASFFSLMRSLQPEEAWLTLEDKCRCFVSVDSVVVLYKKWLSGWSWLLLAVEMHDTLRCVFKMFAALRNWSRTCDGVVVFAAVCVADWLGFALSVSVT